MRNKIWFMIFFVTFFLIINTGCRGKTEKEVTDSEGASQESSKGGLAMIGVEKGEGEGKEPSYVEGEVLLKFKEDVAEEEHTQIIAEYNCSVLSTIESLKVYRIKIPEDKTVPEMVKILNKDERVKYAEPNVIYKLQE